MTMHKVRVQAGAGYDILIQRGLLDQAGSLISGLFEKKTAAIITDTTVKNLYLNRLMTSLDNAQIKSEAYAYEAGEKSKNLSTLCEILEFMAKIPLTRSDYVIALGGGVTGDMAGFAAGCYMRGIPFVQIPTTYLAAVDSSVGGKTAVNLSQGKNLAGLFHQPSLVICDPDCLNTLSPSDYACGAAEAIKMGVISNPDLFSLFENGCAKGNEGEVIRYSVLSKAEIVNQDEREGGVRKLLNLGHTYGHAVEQLSQYEIPHGYAVSIGLAIAVRAACHMNDMNVREGARILSVLEKHHLPTVSPYSAGAMADAAMTDKKRAGAQLSIIVPHKIGHCEIRKIEARKFAEYIALGTEEL